jgi:muramidase (phage lysozyme)
VSDFSKPKKHGYSSLVNSLKGVLILIVGSGLIMFLSNLNLTEINKLRKQLLPNIYGTPPLVMKGGDPYIRALMRTISASEANFLNPYYVIYGGKYVRDLSHHPNVCVRIIRGPNRGKCSTAAGRYQFLNTTWDEKSSQYHPQPSQVLWWIKYSFEPEYQDAVVYNWLNDTQAWGLDISTLLRQGKIEKVLRLLSPTWTSLGYGIEDNSMSKYLPKVYQNMLREELKNFSYNNP